jgi:hypothetical protein
MNAHVRSGALQVVSRIAAALVGGYAFSWGFISLSIAALVAVGINYDDAWLGIMMLAFVIFLVLFLWAFAARSLLKVWLVLVGGAAVMITTAALLVALSGAGL